MILLVISSLTILPFLGLNDFHTKGEPREAIVAVSMIKNGDWILPTNNGGDIAYKPPFFHWCIAVASLCQGHVTEYASRLPSALGLIAMVMGCFLFFAKRKDTSTALIAGLLTLTAFEVHRAGLNCRVDMVLTVFIVLALLQLYKWTERGRKGFPYLSVVFMGLGVLTKGPVGILLPCLVTGVYLLLRGVKFSKALLSLSLIGITSLILPAIWYYFAWQRGGHEFISLVMEENFGRFMGTMSYESHKNPAIYNVVTVIAGLVPWTLLLLFSLFSYRFKKLNGNMKEWWNKLKKSVIAMDNLRLFTLLAIVVIFVFYCIPESKRSVYLLPIYPFIAWFMAEYIQFLAQKKSKSLTAFGYFFSVLSVLLILTFIFVASGLVSSQWFTGKHAAENLLYVQALENTPLSVVNLLFIILPLIPVLWFIGLNRKKDYSKKFIYAICAIILAINVSLDGFYQPTVLNVKSDKPLAKELAIIEPQAPIYSYINDRFLRFYTVDFYLSDRVRLFEKDMPQEGCLLVGKRDSETFLTKYEKEYSFKEILHTANKGCDIGDIIYLYRFAKK
nr:glycosyltransferase family 39 protein [uncultured Bacteroides sp.]